MSTQIKELDRSTTNCVMKRLEALLKPLAEELGVSLTLGKCSFRPTNGRFQVKLSVLDLDGKAITEEMEEFKSYALHYGFSPEDLGKTFVFQRRSFKICGLKPKNRLYPILAKSSDGKGYKFDCQTVLEALGRTIAPDLR